jgi:hypothetical protein
MRLLLAAAAVLVCACGRAQDTAPPDVHGLTEILRLRSYAGWRADPAPHPSSGPHGRVRVFFNDAMVASAGRGFHPDGSIAVKEVYGPGGEVTMHDIMRKSGGAWDWLEGSGPDYAGAATFRGQDNLCARCHASGDDYLRSAIP